MIKRAITISLLVVLALASSSLAQQVIKVGSVPIVHELPLRAAMVNGYFAQEGIKIEPEVMAGGGVLVPALMGGSLQMGQAAYVPVFQARDAGFDIVMVFPYAQQSQKSDPDAILVRADSPIRTPKDLEGKRFVNNVLKSFNWLYTVEWMSMNGVDYKKVNFMEAPFPNMVAMLRTNQVDAVAETEPFVTLEMERGDLRILGHHITGVEPVVQVSGLVATERWVRANSALMERAARALRKGTDYVRAHPEKWAGILATYTRLKPEWVPKLIMPEWKYPIDLERLQFVADLSLKWGLTKKKQKAADAVWSTALK